jgi:hypothetical protein
MEVLNNPNFESIFFALCYTLIVKEEKMRKEFELTAEQERELLNASQPVPMLALQCGMPSSPRERINGAWLSLGRKLGFDYMTVEPVVGKGRRFFTAEVQPHS